MKRWKDRLNAGKRPVLIVVSSVLCCFILSASVSYAAAYFETDQDGHVVDLSTEIAEESVWEESSGESEEFSESQEEFTGESEESSESLEGSTGESEESSESLEESTGESEGGISGSGGLSAGGGEPESESVADQYFYDARSGGVYILDDAGDWSYEPVGVSLQDSVSTYANTAVSIPSDGVVKYRIRFNGTEYTATFAESDAQYIAVVDGLLFNVGPGDKVVGRAFEGEAWNPTRANSYYVNLNSIHNTNSASAMGNGDNINSVQRFWWNGTRVSSEITYGDIEVVETLQSHVDYGLVLLLVLVCISIITFIFARSGSHD